MTRRTSRARRHLHEIERRLDAVEQCIRALEGLRIPLLRRTAVAAPSPSRIEVMQEV